MLSPKSDMDVFCRIPIQPHSQPSQQKTVIGFARSGIVSIKFLVKTILEFVSCPDMSAESKLWFGGFLGLYAKITRRENCGYDEVKDKSQ